MQNKSKSFMFIYAPNSLPLRKDNKEKFIKSINQSIVLVKIHLIFVSFGDNWDVSFARYLQLKANKLWEQVTAFKDWEGEMKRKYFRLFGCALFGTKKKH